MYIKVKDRVFFQELDNNLTLPNEWKQFISERSAQNKLIIKDKKQCKCTNCHKAFKNKVKANDYCKCPNCQNIYLVKTNRLKYYDFKDELAILERYRDYYIVRMFRFETIYQNGQFKNRYYEYARRIYNDQFYLVDEIINDNVVGTTGGMYITYRKDKSTNWRYFKSYYSYLPNYFYYYPYNIKELLNYDEKLKYSQLWELVKHVECDLIYLINNYNPSIELLTKLKLYKLALNPKTFKRKQTFEERFLGLTKDYLPFIQEYNLDIHELTVLSYLKFKDINYIQKYKYLSEDNMRFLKSKVNLVTLIDKTDFGSPNSRFYEYRDYLEMAEKLRLNIKDKNILYPKHIKEAHDQLLKEYRQKKDKILNNAIKKRYKKIKENEFESKKYIIFPAKDFDSLVEESSQQNNCVRTYAENIAKGICDIYFMRLLSDKDKSLVTVEVRDNKVVQQRIKNNMDTTNEQKKFLKKWETEKLGRC